jgi:DNA-binding transcriptional ArsR family regulator
MSRQEDAHGEDPGDARQVRLTAALLEESGDLDELASRLSLLADPRRLRILFCVHACPGIRSSDIARAVGGRESTTSHALALLREAGWVRADREGREVRYSLADPVAHRILHEVGSGHLPGIEHAHPGHGSGTPLHRRAGEGPTGGDPAGAAGA